MNILPIAMVVAFLNALACTSSFSAGIDNSSAGGSSPSGGGGVDSGTGGVGGAAGTDTGGAPAVGGTAGGGTGGVEGAGAIDAGSGGTTGGATGCVSTGSSSPLAMLPADNEFGSWALSGAPVLVSVDAALYNMIDGAAPKYIDRGWVRSAYATYQQSGSSIQVAIYDMGNAENAQTLFAFEMPASRIQINNLPTAVVDMGLPTAYGAYAWSGQYVIEVSIAARSDAALTYVEMFTLNILNRGCAAGTDAGGAPDLAPNLASEPLQHRSTPASCPSQRGPGPSCANTMCSSCSSDPQCIDGKNGRCFPWEGLVSLGGCSYDECFTDSNCGLRTPCLCRSSPTDNNANMCDVGGNCAVDSDCGPGGYCSPSMETCYSTNLEAVVEGRNYGGPNPYYCHTAADLCVNDSDCASLDAGTATTSSCPTYTPCAYNAQSNRWECTQLLCCLP
ncbi:MAG TPA: DUF6599 family protein [Polyangia bacterium]